MSTVLTSFPPLHPYSSYVTLSPVSIHDLLKIITQVLVYIKPAESILCCLYLQKSKADYVRFYSLSGD